MVLDEQPDHLGPDNLAVTPDHQHLGLGSRLLGWIEPRRRSGGEVAISDSAVKLRPGNEEDHGRVRPPSECIAEVQGLDGRVPSWYQSTLAPHHLIVKGKAG